MKRRATKEVNVTLKGFLSLDLIVSDADDGNAYDHADSARQR